MNTKEILQGVKTWTTGKLNTKADKSSTVSDVTYDTNNKKLKKTINGTTSDVVSTAQIILDGGVSQMINTAKSDIVGDAASDYNTLGKIEDKILEEVSRAQDAEDEINDALDNVAHLGEDDGQAFIAGFDPQTDTVWKKAQTLSAAEKEQVQQNIGVREWLNTLTGEKYVSVAATDQTTTSNLKALIDTAAGSAGKEQADTIYRVGKWDGAAFNEEYYSDYAWDGSAYVQLNKKSIVGEVFDVSEYHGSAKYADLTAALDGGNNVPQSLRKGGMSIKYVQSSDNKYVQARLMANAFTTDITKWQVVDSVITAGSKNLAESGAVDADIKLKEFELYGVYPIDGQPALVVGQYFRYNTLYDYKGTVTIAITSANTDLTGFAINIMFRDENDTEVQTRSNVKINQDARTITVNSGTKLVSLERGAGAVVNAGDLNIIITKVDSYDSRIHEDINTVAGQKATFGSGETVNSTNIATDIENDNNGIAVSKDVYDAVYNETHIVDGFVMNENVQTSEDTFSKVLPNIVNGHSYRITLSGSSTLGTGLNLNGYTNGEGTFIHLIPFGSTYDFTASNYDEYRLEMGAGALSEGNVNIQIKELESQNFSSLKNFRDSIYNNPLAVASCCGIVSYQHLFKFNYNILVDGSVGDSFDITNPTTTSYSPTYKCAIVPVSEGDVIKVKALGGSRAVPYALISSDGKISYKESTLNYDGFVTIGENVSYMIVNDKSDGRIGYVYKVSDGTKLNIATQIKRLELVAPMVTTNGNYNDIIRVTKGEKTGTARTITVTVPPRLLLSGGYDYDFRVIDYSDFQTIEVPHGQLLLLNLNDNQLEVLPASSYHNFAKNYVILLINNGGVAFGQWAKYQERETEIYYAESGFNTIRFWNRQGQIAGFPENSLAGCAEAKKRGFNEVRVSVQYTSDNIPVLYHDQYLGTSGKVYDSNGDVVPDSDTTKISDLTYAQLQSYDFGLYAGEKWRGTKICKLEDMLLQCKRLGQSIMLEIKENVTPLIPSNIEETYNLIAYNSMINNTTIHAYEVTTLQAFKALSQRLGLSNVKRVENVTTAYLESMSALNTGKNKVYIGFYRDSMVNMTDVICKNIHDYDILITSSGKTVDELYEQVKYVDGLEYQGDVNPAKLLVKKYFNQN